MNDELDRKLIAALRDDRRALEGDDAFVKRVLDQWQEQPANSSDEPIPFLPRRSTRRIGFPLAAAALIAVAIGVALFARASRRPAHPPDPVAQLVRDLRVQLEVQPQRARHAMDQVTAMFDLAQWLQAIDAMPVAPDPSAFVAPAEDPNGSEI